MCVWMMFCSSSLSDTFPSTGRWLFKINPLEKSVGYEVSRCALYRTWGSPLRVRALRTRNINGRAVARRQRQDTKAAQMNGNSILFLLHAELVRSDHVNYIIGNHTTSSHFRQRVICSCQRFCRSDVIFRYLFPNKFLIHPYKDLYRLFLLRATVSRMSFEQIIQQNLEYLLRLLSELNFARNFQKYPSVYL